MATAIARIITAAPMTMAAVTPAMAAATATVPAIIITAATMAATTAVALMAAIITAVIITGIAAIVTARPARSWAQWPAACSAAPSIAIVAGGPTTAAAMATPA